MGSIDLTRVFGVDKLEIERKKRERERREKREERREKREKRTNYY